MQFSRMRSSMRCNAFVDTRQPTVVIVDITRDITSPEDASQFTPWPAFEPYSTSIRIDFTPSDVNPQLLSSSLEYFKSLTGVRAPVKDTSAIALSDVKVTSMPHETGSDSRDDITDLSSHVAATIGFASWPLVTVNKGISFAVATVNANEEAAETLSASTSRDITRLSPADSENISSGVSTRYEEPTEAKNGVDINNCTTQPSPSHTRLSHGTGSGKSYMATEYGGLTLPNTYTETRTWTPSSSSTARTLAPGPHGAIMDGTEFSRPLSQRGVALMLGSVLGGTLVFICMVFSHRLILRLFHRSKQGSTMRRGPVSMDDPFVKQTPTVSSNVADISHFSADSEDMRCIDYQKQAKKVYPSR
ncbi:hypothetical protein N7490_002101 [Penicillium lividum]|nr:hypothetical protein N7490_002101 [Penicillium lividum]